MVKHIRKILKTDHKLKMTTQIGYYDMDYIILDLGSDVNILTRQTWESMGKLRLVWSPVQLRLANQSKVLPVGRLTQVPVEIEGLKTYVDFEVIDIVDDANPSPTLLGIEWAINNQTIINFNKIILTFEDSYIMAIAPIDPLEGQRYVDPVNSEGQRDYLDQIYNITSTRDDYVNPTTDIKISWCNVNSYTSDFGEALEN